MRRMVISLALLVLTGACHAGELTIKSPSPNKIFEPGGLFKVQVEGQGFDSVLISAKLEGKPLAAEFFEEPPYTIEVTLPKDTSEGRVVISAGGTIGDDLVEADDVEVEIVVPSKLIRVYTVPPEVVFLPTTVYRILYPFGMYKDGVRRKLLVGNTWTSNDPTVVTISQGLIKPVGIGQTTVTVTNKGKSATVLVEVIGVYKE